MKKLRLTITVYGEGREFTAEATLGGYRLMWTYATSWDSLLLTAPPEHYDVVRVRGV